MDFIVRAIDVGYGHTKYVNSTGTTDVLCDSFPSLAPIAGSKAIAEALGRKRNTVEIAVDELVYEVGPDAALAQGVFAGRNMDDDYCLTPEYLALVRGALHYMRVQAVDLLVVGLPVSTFLSKRAALRQRLLGPHELPRGTVHVRDVLVLSQPHGALGAYGLGHRMYQSIKEQMNLVIDCGSRTFDWIVAKGFRTVEQRSRAVNRGMTDVVEAIVSRLEQDLGATFRDFERIDRALRTKTAPMIMHRRIDLRPYMPYANKIAQDAVQELKRRVEAGTDIDNVIVAGGGAFFFKPFIQDAYPNHHIYEMPEGMMANVKGFQLYGMEVEAARRRERAAAIESRA